MVSASLRILLVGRGGREHALAWKLSRSKSVEHVYVVPGNGGTQLISKVSNCNNIDRNDYPGMIELAKQLEINLAVVGLEEAVVGGLGDYFREGGIRCFCPSKISAAIEGSKNYAKMFMEKNGIPTAPYTSFNNYKEAKAYLESLNGKRRVVIKADGLAEGKGVIIPETLGEAQKALEDMMLSKTFGSAGETVVIEDYLEGYEISLLTFSDGNSILSLPPGQDHKRVLNGNQGPNTPGMGVYSPVPRVTPEDMASIEKSIVQKTIRGLSAENRPFNGLLFTGIMMTTDGPQVLEYNARFGDPETQSMLLLLADDVLPEILLACIESRLDQTQLQIQPGFACAVTVTPRGYPQKTKKGDIIRLESPPEGVQVFHSGTKWVKGQLITTGGRVFSVAAKGETLQEAVDSAYKGVQSIHFDGMYFRKDIAASSLGPGSEQLKHCL